MPICSCLWLPRDRWRITGANRMLDQMGPLVLDHQSSSWGLTKTVKDGELEQEDMGCALPHLQQSSSLLHPGHLGAHKRLVIPKQVLSWGCCATPQPYLCQSCYQPHIKPSPTYQAPPAGCCWRGRLPEWNWEGRAH